MTQRSPASSHVEQIPEDPEAALDASSRPRIRFGMILKSTIATLVVGLVPLALFGAITLVQQGNRIREAANESMRGNAERIASEVDEWVDKNARMLQAAASTPAISSMQRDEQTRVLAAIRKAFPWMYLVFTIAPTGANIARSDELALADYGDRQYFKDVVAGTKELSWETVISKTTGKPVLILAVPIRVNGAVVGVLAAGTTIEELSRIVVTWRAGSTGYAFLVDENSKVIAHPHEDYVLSQRRLPDHPMVAAFRGDGQSHLASFSEGGSDALGYVRGNRFRWAVVVQQNANELFAPQRQTELLGLLLLVGAAVLVTVSAVMSSKILVRPIVEMTHAADRMSLGELDTPIQLSNTDELGMLAKALERLRKSMSAAIARM